MAAVEHLFDRLDERVELAARLGIVEVLGHEQAGMRAHLAQSRERREHVHGRRLGAFLIVLR